jgi:hypothetical protein
MLDYEELPETYGVDECELLYRDPHNAFTYWEVTEAGLAAARAQLGQSAEGARRVLRLFITSPGGDGATHRDLSDLEVHWNHGRRYLHVPHAGAQVRVAIGLLSKEGYFAPIAHSSLVRLPPAGPSSEAAVEWMEVVPARGRGTRREPIVIVRSAADHAERAVGEDAARLPPRGEGSSGKPPAGGSGRW